jgi:hypothetical protein
MIGGGLAFLGIMIFFAASGSDKAGIGGVLFLIGIIMFIYGKIGAFWYHG